MTKPENLFCLRCNNTKVLATPNLFLKLMRRLSYCYYVFLKFYFLISIILISIYSNFSLKFIYRLSHSGLGFTMWPIKVKETSSKLDESENEIKEDLNFTRAS